jgi:hypothetical protein
MTEWTGPELVLAWFIALVLVLGLAITLDNVYTRPDHLKQHDDEKDEEP